MPRKALPDPTPPPLAAFELSDHLPYLFKHIYAQLEAASAGQLARFGINVAVWRIVAVLWKHGDLSHRELSDLTSIEVSTLSRISKAVQRDGLIRRTRTEADQRTVRVTLTDKGRELAQQIIPWALEVQQEIVGDLPSEDVTTLIRILRVIADNLSSYRESDFDAPQGAGPSPPPAGRSAAARPAAGSAPARKRPVKALSG